MLSPLEPLLLAVSGDAGTVDLPFSTFFLFATAVAAGITAALLPLPIRAIGRRFFILMTLVAVCFLALATVAAQLDINAFHIALAGLLIAYNVTVPRQIGVDVSEQRRAREGGGRAAATWGAQGLLLLAALSGGVALVEDSRRLAALIGFGGAEAMWLAVSFLGSSLLLGTTVVTMTLGHWYLVLPKLSFRPLAWMTVLLLVMLIVRLAVVAAGTVLQRERWRELLADGWSAFLLDPGIFVGVRALFGFAAPLAFAWMAWRCVRIESNQSATGILYVVLAFVLIGEIIARYFLISEGLLL